MLWLARAMSASSGGKKPSPFCRIWTALPGRMGEPVRLAIDGRACSKAAIRGTLTCDCRSCRTDQIITNRKTTMKAERIKARCETSIVLASQRAMADLGSFAVLFSFPLCLSSFRSGRLMARSPGRHGCVRDLPVELDQPRPVIRGSRPDHLVGRGRPARVGEDVVDALPHEPVGERDVVTAHPEQLGGHQGPDLRGVGR